MSFLRQFFWKTSRSENAALLERIAELEFALARRPAGMNLKLVVAIATITLGIGFALGVNKDEVVRAAGNLLPWVERSDLPADLAAGKAAYDRGDYAKALGLVQPLAEKGDARAQDLVGEIFYHRRDPAPDDAEAMKWFRAAAKQGSAAAQVHLGEMYELGRGAAYLRVTRRQRAGIVWPRINATRRRNTILR